MPIPYLLQSYLKWQYQPTALQSKDRHRSSIRNLSRLLTPPSPNRVAVISEKILPTGPTVASHI